MSAIRSKGMKPEMTVRSLVHSLGFRYRLHRKDLPGKPDLVFGPRRKVIFVHGCFWHQHPDPACIDGRLPKSRTEYWHTKLARNVERDRLNCETLEDSGWQVMTIWECETTRIDLANRIQEFLGCTPSPEFEPLPAAPALHRHPGTPISAWKPTQKHGARHDRACFPPQPRCCFGAYP